MEVLDNNTKFNLTDARTERGKILNLREDPNAAD
jgi:hypothetical protein